MSKVLDVVQRFRKIEEATAAKDDPAPVYLLDEIADMARQSPETAQAIADTVEKKLGNKSPIVKFKALRIIKHLCLKGCSTFQRCMQRHSSSVRELIHFKGDPDPFKGDVPNARVREFAKEVVEVLFNANPVTSQPTNTLAAQGKIQGFGSNSGPESRSGGFTGYGSTSSSGARGGSGSTSSNMTAYVPTSLNQLGSQLGAQLAAGDGLLAQGLASAASAVNDLLGRGQYGNRLTEGRDSPTRDYGSMPSYAAPVTHHVVTSTQVLGNEEAAVTEICTPAGLRPVPDPADLRHFVEVISGMDGLRVAELLREKMEASSSWQVQLRALSALETVLQRGSSQACGEVAVMFQSDPTPVRQALQHAQQAVRAVAARVIKLLLNEDVAVAPAAGGKGTPTAAAAAAAAPMMDLLSLDDPPAAAAAPAPAAVDLLAGLDVPVAAAPVAAAPASGLELLGGAAPAAPAALDGDMFGGLHVAAAPAAAPAPAAPAAAVDLLGGLSLAPGAPASSSSSSTAYTPAASSSQAVGLGAPGSANLLGSPTFGGPSAAAAAGVLPGGFQAPQGQVNPGLAGPLQMPGSWDLGAPAGMAAKPAGANGTMAGQVPPGQLMGQVSAGSLMLGGGMGAAMPGVPLSHPQLLQQKLGVAPTVGLPGTVPGVAALGRSSSSGSQTPGAAGLQAWTGKDEVSNLMRSVASGGKHDPAFDWMKDEFGKKK